MMKYEIYMKYDSHILTNIVYELCLDLRCSMIVYDSQRDTWDAQSW